MRAQSVFEVLEEDGFFMACRFAKGNDANDRWRFRVDQRDSHATQESEGHEPLLLIAETVVLHGVCHSVEDGGGITKVEAVHAQIRPALALVPRETHLRSVYTLRRRVNEKGRPLTIELSAAAAAVWALHFIVHARAPAIC